MSKYTENFPNLSTYDFDTIMCQLRQVCGADPSGLINAQFLSRPTTAKDIAQLFYCTYYIMQGSENLQKQYVELYTFVKDFFTNLDLQEEVNNKLDIMIEDGTFENVITPLISQYATPHFVESEEEMTNHSYIYVLNSTGNVWTWNGSEFIDTGVQYIGGIQNILRNYGVLPTGNDLNTIAQNSAYILIDTNKYENSPIRLGTLITYVFSTNLSTQFAYDFTFGYSFYRRKVSNKWQDWKRVDMCYIGTTLDDLNNAETMSLYIVDQDIPNKPEDGTFFVYTYGTNTGAKMQYAVNFQTGKTYLRVYSISQNKWLNWYNTTYLNGAFMYMGVLSEDLNIDSLNENTLYVYDSSSHTIDNLPEVGSGFFLTFGGTTKFQLFVRTNAGRTFIRYFSKSNWSEWFTFGFQYLSTELTNCNHALPNGFYILNPGEVDNLPIEQTGFLFCFGIPSSAKIQLYVVYSTGEIFYRRTTTPFTEYNYTEWKSITSGEGGFQTTAKMFSIGNSILTGSVWVNGSYNHLANYGNAPYSVIADALQLRESNVSHTLLSSTGLLYNAGEGNFLTNIKSTDLSEYDVLLTHLWTRDLDSNFSLGTINSQADDGSLAGAVKSLIDYMKTSNGMCQLILVGIPPVSTSIYGESVFTGTYPNGSSISQCNALMHQLADKYHFTFVDWEDLNLSYYYQDYTDGSNVHANNENTYRVMGAYLAGKATSQLTF